MTETEVIRRNLKRPSVVPTEVKPKGKSEVQQLIEKEMLSLIYSDAIDNPIEGTIFPEKNAPNYCEKTVSAEQISQAKKLIAEEMKQVREEAVFDEKVYLSGRKRVKVDFGKKEAKVLQKHQNEH